MQSLCAENSRASLFPETSSDRRLLQTGNILLIGQIWDAISNPIIGKLTDSINTRWGRRRVRFKLCIQRCFCVLKFLLSSFGLIPLLGLRSRGSQFALCLLVCVFLEYLWCGTPEVKLVNFGII